MLTPKTASTRNWKASMAQDVTKGRPTEIDYMNGHVVAQGRAKGVPTPVSAAVVDIMHEVESGARKPAPENIARRAQARRRLGDSGGAMPAPPGRPQAAPERQFEGHGRGPCRGRCRPRSCRS